MVRTNVYLFVAIVVLGAIATPGLGAFAFVVAPLLGLGLVWRIALTVSTHGRPVDGANIPRPGVSGTQSVRPRGENSIHGGSG